MNTFEKLNQIDVSEHIEKKMNLSYLSWAWAHQEMKKIDENSQVEIHEFPHFIQIGDTVQTINKPYLSDKGGAWVKVSVTINDRTETEYLPVMDMRNKALAEPDAMSINKAHKRCFVKALALHGLGLYIYAGSDLPEAPPEPTASEKHIDKLKDTLKHYADITGNGDEAGIGKLNAWALGQLGVENFADIPEKSVEPFLKKVNAMIKKAEAEKKPEPKKEKQKDEQESLFEGSTTKPKE